MYYYTYNELVPVLQVTEHATNVEVHMKNYSSYTYYKKLLVPVTAQYSQQISSIALYDGGTCTLERLKKLLSVGLIVQREIFSRVKFSSISPLAWNGENLTHENFYPG